MTLIQPAPVPWARPRHTIDTLRDGWIAPQGTATTGVAWGTANRAVYVPVRVPTTVIVRELGVVNGTTATGNIDIGIYTSTGVRLVSTGSVAKSGTTAVQAIDITDTTIGPGLYYLALNNDTTTDTFYALEPAAPTAAARGTLTEALGALALPATATWVQNYTLTFHPTLSMLLVTEVS